MNKINLLSSNEQNANKNTGAYYIMYIMLCVNKKYGATVKFKVQKDQQWFSSKQLAFCKNNFVEFPYCLKLKVVTPTLKTPAE